MYVRFNYFVMRVKNGLLHRSSPTILKVLESGSGKNEKAGKRETHNDIEGGKPVTVKNKKIV